MSPLDLARPLQPQLLAADGPVCLILTARLTPVGGIERFQPAGFPEVGHVIYDAPRTAPDGRKYKEKVCIVDSPASMANHLEKVCLAGDGTMELHPDLSGLPHVVCVTDQEFETVDGQIIPKKDAKKDSPVASTLTEGHRLASDYFLDARTFANGEPSDKTLRDQLRKGFEVVEIKKDRTYFIPPASWWKIYKTVFECDPNSLVHGVMFAKEQIKISRLLAAHLEAFGAARVGRSGVKFDRLGKTTSGQPIFSVDEETAEEILATFILDLALLRSYGRGDDGLGDTQKQLLLELALWKISRLVKRPFRFRTQCFLQCESIVLSTEDGPARMPNVAGRVTDRGSTDADAKRKEEERKAAVESAAAAERLFGECDIRKAIENCRFKTPMTNVYYAANELFKPGRGTAPQADQDSQDDQDAEGDGNE